MQTIKDLTIFNIVNNLLRKTDENLYKHPSFKSVFNKYMVLRIISMIPELIEYSSYFNDNVFDKFSKEDMYKILYNTLPYNTSNITYIKKVKTNVNEY